MCLSKPKVPKIETAAINAQAPKAAPTLRLSEAARSITSRQKRGRGSLRIPLNSDKAGSGIKLPTIPIDDSIART